MQRGAEEPVSGEAATKQRGGAVREHHVVQVAQTHAGAGWSQGSQGQGVRGSRHQAGQSPFIPRA